jgi:predicted small lipoprotein YifL
MSKSARLVLVLAAVAALAACAKKAEPMPEPIPAEPVETGKYK